MTKNRSIPTADTVTFEEISEEAESIAKHFVFFRETVNGDQGVALQLLILWMNNKT